MKKQKQRKKKEEKSERKLGLHPSKSKENVDDFEKIRRGDL